MGNLLIQFTHGHVADGAIKSRVCAGIQCAEALVITRRAVELFLLRVKLGERAQEFGVVRLGLESRFVFSDEPLGGVFGFLDAILLLKLLGLVFVLENLAV